MTPMLLSAFWTYTLITALTPGPNNILALSAATAHGFRQSIRGTGRYESGIFGRYAAVRRDRVFPCGYRSGIIHLLSWVGAAYILWLAWKIATSPAADENARPKPVGFWVSFGLQFVNVKIILYGITALSTFVLPQTQALNWVIGVSILLALIGTFGNVCWGAGGTSVSAGVSPLWSPVKYHSGVTAGVLRGADFY
ncbi:Transporter LysE family [Salmonella enterica subsp. enterica]|uniref:Transporter LysE family n=1 Tax=Salmonella enterica I TaxID=59201 RepID=A0A379W4M4_SALET|nr:Transporter LysE family [Salmonella enterica subsp. enterica]